MAALGRLQLMPRIDECADPAGLKCAPAHMRSSPDVEIADRAGTSPTFADFLKVNPPSPPNAAGALREPGGRRAGTGGQTQLRAETGLVGKSSENGNRVTRFGNGKIL